MADISKLPRPGSTRASHALGRLVVFNEACTLCCSPARATYLLFMADQLGDIQHVWVETQCSNPTCHNP
jgi:hypothetical protein